MMQGGASELGLEKFAYKLKQPEHHETATCLTFAVGESAGKSMNMLNMPGYFVWNIPPCLILHCKKVCAKA
jgi:hypothetical protein